MRQLPKLAWVMIAVLCAAMLWSFQAGIHRMLETWTQREEYSHGFLIPFIALFLIWQRRDELARSEFQGSWAGLALVVGGFALNAIGSLATLYTLQQYGMLFALYGVVLALVGWRTMRLLWAPLLILLFMIPLPEFLLNNFSARLQLLSSQIGVAFIRLFHISVFVEGNVIDLGSYQLQVAEACSGLRYLFPLMTLGFLMAYFYKAATWKRAVLFLSSIPVTILMNSLRIGLIGVTVDRWGVAMAEGLLHDFEGWVVFMASAALLILEMILLTRLGREKRPWREVFGVDLPPPRSRNLVPATRAIPVSFMGTSALLGFLALGLLLLPERAEAHQQRLSFAEFPSRIGAWEGQREPLADVYLTALKLDDYVMADFARNGSSPVNLYVAWYDSQRSGQSAHSPRSCLPGGGWRVRGIDPVALEGVQIGGAPLRVNRAVIELGSHKQVVYYWFQQRGRAVTNEYLVKWFIFWDALTRNRTDGAMVRLSAPVLEGGDVAVADAALQEFARSAAPLLAQYIPS